MKLFSYVARTIQGEKKTGNILAESQDQAAEILLAKNLIPVEFILQSASGKKALILWSNRIQIDELMAFLRKMYFLVKTGTPVDEALANVIADIRQRSFKKALQQVRENLLLGNSLAEALAMSPKFFSPFVVSVIQAAEKRGELEVGFYNLYKDMTYNYKIRKISLSAFLYPLSSLVASIILVFIISFYLVPKLLEFFEARNIALPLSTRIIVSVSHFMINYFFLWFGGLIFLIALYFVLRNFSGFRLESDRIKYKIPIFGQLAFSSAMLRFSRYIYLLLLENIPVDEVITLAAGSFRNFWLQNKASQIGGLMRQGYSLYQSFVKVKAFPLIMLRMIKTGEETNTLQESFKELADMFAFATKEKLERMSELLRPMILVVVMIIIIVIIIGMYQPLFMVMQSLLKSTAVIQP